MSKLNLGLYEHVEDAIQAVIKTKADKGRVVIPTGGGKTAVEAHSLRLRGLRGGFEIHLVLAPRIALVNQLMKEYRGYIGHDYLAVAFHSAKNEPDYQTVKWEELATTSTDVIIEQIERAKQMGKHLVIFSTYHSCWKLTNFKFGMLIADESQYCVTEDYFKNIVDISAEFKLFCTATEKHVVTTDFGRGQNNETVYGGIIYQVAPSELINKGIIVAPRLHVLEGKPINSGMSSVVDEVINIAKEQHKLTLEHGMKFSKILFAMKGTDDIRKVIANIAKIKQEMPGHKIFTIISNDKYGAMIDGQKSIKIHHAGQVWENKISRGVFFKELRECDNALIFHYDIISEGIDIDGITGVAILRNMTLSKLLQTIGRAVRKFKANPKAKPQAWVTVTVIDGDAENREWVKSVLEQIRLGGFEVNAENIAFSGHDGPGTDEDEGLEDQYGQGVKSSLQTVLSDIVHEIEDGLYWKSLAKMSFAERLKLTADAIKIS